MVSCVVAVFSVCPSVGLLLSSIIQSLRTKLSGWWRTLLSGPQEMDLPVGARSLIKISTSVRLRTVRRRPPAVSVFLAAPVVSSRAAPLPTTVAQTVEKVGEPSEPNSTIVFNSRRHLLTSHSRVLPPPPTAQHLNGPRRPETFMAMDFQPMYQMMLLLIGSTPLSCSRFLSAFFPDIAFLEREEPLWDIEVMILLMRSINHFSLKR